ncbi:hypothetical protein ATANTOWER_021761 [Ataeniobius toweri]|uniref:Uncharacterized protein n=1 Tax=Ataeniobius toweri TaxID=208326 RepID=A0ABU7A7Y9_9TELE|nr:hypothetical protein [Ataeniobius toweri]
MKYREVRVEILWPVMSEITSCFEVRSKSNIHAYQACKHSGVQSSPCVGLITSIYSTGPRSSVLYKVPCKSINTPLKFTHVACYTQKQHEVEHNCELERK